MRALACLSITVAAAACSGGGGSTEVDAPTQCADGIDNDGDGHTDFPDDRSCQSASDNDESAPVTPMCQDHIDNDGDGKVDFPNDPGCLVPNQDSETDDCPNGPNCPECADGMDNDFDGHTDYPNDPECSSASDDTEFDLGPDACGAGTPVTLLPPNGTATGTIGTGASHLSPVRCSGAVGTGSEAAYVVTVSAPTTLVATTDDPATTVDTVLYIRKACTITTTELACNNDISATNTHSTITADLTPGTYFLIVDGRSPGSTGNYTLHITKYAGIGEACTMSSQCAPTYTCRVPAGDTTMSCQKPVCNDGRDDDGDTKIDFPNDPGCTSPDDSTEDDSCPSGAGCPVCANGMDDDGDGHTDYPADTSCASASAGSEYDCPTQDPVRMFTGNVSNQSMATLNNDIALSCGTNGRDEVYLLHVGAPLSQITIDTLGSTIDTALGLRRASCAGFDLQCDDDGAGNGDSSLFLVGVTVGDYYIIVDDKNTAGTYNLNVHGVFAPGAACDPASTAFVCDVGYTCTGPVGSATCTPAACNDNVDADGDGFPGFPTDPGCTSISDNDESDNCPGGAGCPACGNQLDDDGDTLIDYPGDPGCLSASANTELSPCTSGDPVINLTQGSLVNVTTIGQRLNDVAPSCGINGRDEIYRLVVPTPLTRLTIDTLGSPLDTVVTLRSGTCNGTDLACDDNTGGNGDSLIVRNNVGIGEYFIAVEDRGVTSPGAYNLNVRGELAVGQSCNPASTLFVCQAGYACTGAPGAATCQPAACNDTVDADGDGFPGYPSDPGCTSISDGDESDDCPSGPNCPQCGNRVDDDGDGAVDYPTDPGCTAASDTDERAVCLSSDPVIPATASVTGASTATRLNDIALSCGTNGRDEIYRVVVTQPLVQLKADTIGSALDTVVGIRRNDCQGSDLVCDDNGGGGTASQAVINNPSAGEYFVVVDDKGVASPGTYNLHIKGTLAPNAACDPASTMFVCVDAYACLGAPGATTCQPGPCNDNVDQDGDGKVGYPDDPGCTSIADLDESDDCPAGPNCPQCGNHVDDDSDGQTDWPADVTCGAASDNTEAAICSSADPVFLYTTPVVGASTAIRLNDVTPSCGTNGRDDIYRVVVDRPVARLIADTTGSALDTVITLRRTNCNSTDLACDDNGGGGTVSRIVYANAPAGEYFVSVEDKNVASPPTYNLTITAELPANASCDPASTFYKCGTGFACNGAAGSETCVAAQCNDNIDQDGDGKLGYPDDPGCTDISDNDESDTCPGGATCPQCGNGIDDDSDTRIDWPMDFGCIAASSPSERECPMETDPIGLITMPTTLGTTAGATNNFTPTCQTLNNNDVGYVLVLPVPVATLRIDTTGAVGFDTVLQVFDVNCQNRLACDDDSGGSFRSLITLTNVAAGGYFISVDGYSSNNGPFTLNVLGTVAPGTACNSSAFTSGVLACPTGTTCTSGVCQ